MIFQLEQDLFFLLQNAPISREFFMTQNGVICCHSNLFFIQEYSLAYNLNILGFRK